MTEIMDNILDVFKKNSDYYLYVDRFIANDFSELFQGKQDFLVEIHVRTVVENSEVMLQFKTSLQRNSNSNLGLLLPKLEVDYNPSVGFNTTGTITVSGTGQTLTKLVDDTLIENNKNFFLDLIERVMLLQYKKSLVKKPHFNIKSTCHGDYYDLKCCLDKMHDRASIYYDHFEFSDWSDECEYGSKDCLLTIKGLRVSEPLWSDSLNFTLDLSIPVHFTRGNKFKLFSETTSSKTNFNNPVNQMEVEGTLTVFNEDVTEKINIDRTFVLANYTTLTRMIEKLMSRIFIDHSVQSVENEE